MSTITSLETRLHQKMEEMWTYDKLIEQMQAINTSALYESTPKHMSFERSVQEQTHKIHLAGSTITDLMSRLSLNMTEQDYQHLSKTFSFYRVDVEKQLMLLMNELDKEKKKVATLNKQLEQELENEDTMLTTISSLEKQVSQTSWNL
eukprot:TRINITY_DN5009_c0_g2_i1.p1 TRINITY_DN5009_c0_g2~~TRINITY_DN5009_c0_g2_i1.p1  ORF type:complete len:148 (-),score=32.93 TRINITY_DN5009_c0_g2_i1:238-681(-)